MLSVCGGGEVMFSHVSGFDVFGCGFDVGVENFEEEVRVVGA